MNRYAVRRGRLAGIGVAVVVGCSVACSEVARSLHLSRELSLRQKSLATKRLQETALSGFDDRMLGSLSSSGWIAEPRAIASVRAWLEAKGTIRETPERGLLRTWRATAEELPIADWPEFVVELGRVETTRGFAVESIEARLATGASARGVHVVLTIEVAVPAMGRATAS
jgi:hypothetical protein